VGTTKRNGRGGIKERENCAKKKRTRRGRIKERETYGNKRRETERENTGEGDLCKQKN
jgi:hypothetical protein